MQPLTMLPFSYQHSFEKQSKKNNDPTYYTKTLPLSQALDQARKNISYPSSLLSLTDTQYNKIQSSIKDYLKISTKLPLYLDLPTN